MANKTEKSGSPATLITRVVVFGALAALLVLAGLDFRAKKSAEATADAFRKAIQDKPDGDVLKSQLKPLTQGSPTVSSADPKTIEGMNFSETVEVYVWKGILRNYSVQIGYGVGNDPPVENVNGPISSGG